MYPQWKSSIDHSFPYITGNGFSVYAKYVLNYDNFRQNKYIENNWYFVKTDYIAKFFNNHYPNREFVLITHNSDYPINQSYEKYLNDKNVKAWFAQNADFEHQKLHPIPIGVANAGYAHGDTSVITKVREKENKKDKMFYVNFTVDNNRNERMYCLEQTGLTLEQPKDGIPWKGFAGGYSLPATFENYLNDMSQHLFAISPQGNGKDCHRVWEALYLRTIPVVTKSCVINAHKDYPMIVLDDWKDFKDIKFSQELYDKIWNNFNVGEIHMDNYLKRMKKITGE